jgi:hypothetical protein
MIITKNIIVYSPSGPSSSFNAAKQYAGDFESIVLSAIFNVMPDTPPPRFRVFAFKDFIRFARKFHISDKGIWDVLRSQPDADLGGGLYKYRIARPGEGSRGGGRVLIALKIGSRAILMFAWEKKDMENVRSSELKAYRDLAKIYLRFTDFEMTKLVKDRVLVEIFRPREGELND